MLRDQKDQKETIKSGAADIFSFHQQHLWPHQENIKKRNFSAPCGTAALKHWFEEFPHLSHSVTPSQWKKRTPSATEQQPLCSVQLRDSMLVATTADQALETWKAWSCGQVLCSTAFSRGCQSTIQKPADCRHHGTGHSWALTSVLTQTWLQHRSLCLACNTTFLLFLRCSKASSRDF